MNNDNKLNIHVAVLLMLLALAACGKSEAPVEDAAKAEHAEGAEHSEENGEEHEEGGHIKLTDEQIKSSNISLRQVGPAAIRETLPLYGVIAPNAERVREVAARFPGVIRAVDKKVGDSVRQGETLATVESNESLQTYPVGSPLAGVVTMRNANPGEQSGDKMLFTVADLSSVWVELSLFPRDVAKVRVGQSVRVQSTEAGLQEDGKVVYVAPLGSSSSQTLTARVLLDNSDRKWAPGLYVTADVTLAESQVPLAIRSEAVQSMEGGSVVFVRGEEGFEPRPVKLGRSDGELTEVLDGVKAGETYVGANSYILKAELGKGSAEHGH